MSFKSIRASAAIAVVMALTLASALASATPPPPPGGRDKPIPGTRHVFRGSIERSGRAKLTVRLVHTGHVRARKYSLVLRRVRARCNGHWLVVQGPITGGMTIWNRYAHDGQFFSGVSVDGDPRHPSFAETSKGRLLPPGVPLGQALRARGIVRVWGSSVPLRGGHSERCRSGRLRWRAGSTSGWHL